MLHGHGGRVQGEEIFWTVIDPVQPLLASNLGSKMVPKMRHDRMSRPWVTEYVTYRHEVRQPPRSTVRYGAYTAAVVTVKAASSAASPAAGNTEARSRAGATR